MPRLPTGYFRVVMITMIAGGLQACSSTPPLAEKVEPEILKQSDALRRERKQAAAVPLEHRIAAIEADIARELVPAGDGVLAPHYLRASGRKGPLQLEINAALLSALAAKYAATGDDDTKALAEKLIKGILHMDAATGKLDGLVAFELDPQTLEPSNRPTNANAYTQLLFAYVLADRHLGQNKDIRKHISLIYERFVEDDFRLRQRDGSFDNRTNLSGSSATFNARRAADRRLLDAAAKHLGNDRARELARKHKWTGTTLVPRHLRLFNLEVPTASSSWLNLQALTALSLLEDDEDHRKDAIALANHYEDDNNPFFRLLAAINGDQQNLAAIRRRLEEFPYPATNAGIINSHRDDIEIERGDYIKFKAAPEVDSPLPLYDISSHEYIWKRRLRAIDEEHPANLRTLLGYDLLQAYWLLRMMEMNSFNHISRTGQ